MRDQYVYICVTLRGNGPRPEDSAVRDERHAHGCTIYIDGLVIYIEAVGGDRIHQVRVFQGRGRRAEARRLVVTRCDQVGDFLACDAESLFQETDDHMRRRAHRIEDIAGMDNQVYVAFQNGVDCPPVSLLDVDLALIAASLLMELRVPRVPQVCIRDVGDPYDLIPLFETALFWSARMSDSPGLQARV